MQESFEIEHPRVWWHCGWAVAVDPELDGEVCDDGRTLRLFDDAREVSLSSNRFDRNDGVPFRAEEVFEWFPPPHLAGERFAHEDADHVGRAVWVAVPGDGPTRTWLLVPHRRESEGLTAAGHSGRRSSGRASGATSSSIDRATPG